MPTEHPTTQPKHPVSVLMEHAQRKRVAKPTFTYEISGDPHMPTVTCVCSYFGKAIRVVAGSKKEAKKGSAEGMVKLLS